MITGLIPELGRRGLAVSTVKHTHHNVAIDRPGDASRLLAEAGATDVLVRAAQGWAVLHENREGPEPDLGALLARMDPVDLVLVEGFKQLRHDKIEVHRRAAGTPLLYPEDPSIVAVATDAPLAAPPVPRLDLDDVPAIAEFIADRYGLATTA